jgi:hypothetical protein
MKLIVINYIETCRPVVIPDYLETVVARERS